MLNVRLQRLIFPGWRINLQTDQATYEAYKNLFDKLDIDIEVHQNNVPLTLAMLWRLRPCFDRKYTHIICRDIESPLTYRDAQAVKYWIDRGGKAAHAITDSISHNIPMLGGMIGFMTEHFGDRTNTKSWSELVSKGSYDWTRKGTDQTFLNDIVYPCFAKQGSDSITQHYFKGHPNTFLSDYRTCSCKETVGHETYCPNNTELSLSHEMIESNSICGHIGSFGWYDPQMFKFLRKHKDEFTDLIEIEKQYPVIFHWTQDGTFE
jgi:hypothetical protein